jgi:hypothetical protein
MFALASIGAAQVTTPVFTPPAGTYSSAQTASISTTTSGASIRYTTDGSTPSETAGTLYNGPITVSTTTTINAIAYVSGMTDSSIASAGYTINLGSSSAQFVRTDSTAQGSWKGTYGGDGFNVIDDTTAYPSYVTVTPSGQSNYVWNSTTSEVRALQRQPPPPTALRRLGTTAALVWTLVSVTVARIKSLFIVWTGTVAGPRP